MKDFNPANKEHFSSAADTGMTGHFTQVVWRDTTHVGCGIASYPDGDFTCAVKIEKIDNIKRFKVFVACSITYDCK